MTNVHCDAEGLNTLRDFLLKSLERPDLFVHIPTKDDLSEEDLKSRQLPGVYIGYRTK